MNNSARPRVKWPIPLVVALFIRLHTRWSRDCRFGKPAGKDFNPKYFTRCGYNGLMAHLRRKRERARYLTVVAALPEGVRRDWTIRAPVWNNRKIIAGLREMFARWEQDREHGALASKGMPWGPGYLSDYCEGAGDRLSAAIRRQPQGRRTPDYYICRMERRIRTRWHRQRHPWDVQRAKDMFCVALRAWQNDAQWGARAEKEHHFNTLYLQRARFSWLLSGAYENYPGGIQQLAKDTLVVRDYWLQDEWWTDDELRAEIVALWGRYKRDPEGLPLNRPFGISYLRAIGKNHVGQAMRARGGVAAFFAGDEFREIREAWCKPPSPRETKRSLRIRRQELERRLRAKASHLLKQRRACGGLTHTQIDFGLVAARRKWEAETQDAPEAIRPSFDRDWLRAAGIMKLVSAVDAAAKTFDRIARKNPFTRHDWVGQDGKRCARPSTTPRSALLVSSTEWLVRKIERQEGARAKPGDAHEEPSLETGPRYDELEEVEDLMGS